VRRAALLGLSLALGALSCRGKPRPEGAPPASSTAPPVDRLAPGEPAPGQEAVHGLLLPRGAAIDRRFGHSVYVRVPHSVGATAEYVRRQCDPIEGAVVGPTGTIFTVARVKGAPRTHHLRIEITAGERLLESALLVIDWIDDEQPGPPKGLSNDELMKKAGLTPDGKFLDPQHME
jgi:hypothetical protein